MNSGDSAPAVDSGPSSASVVEAVPPGTVGVAGAALVGAWIGLASGLGEVALICGAKFVLGRFTQVNPQVVWMAPAGYALLGAATAALLAVLLRRRPGAPVRAAAAVALFVGSLGPLFLVQSLHKGAAALLAAGIALQGSRIIGARAAKFLRLVRATRIPLAGLVLLLGVGLNAAFALADARAAAATAARPAPPAGAPNVLVVVWDTVRAANLSLHGYSRPTTPALDRLAARGTAFDRAMSPAPWTLPSHASMFTGLHPRDLSADWAQPLEEGPRTLAEVLRDRGWRTGGFTANVGYTGRASGVARGFDRYCDFPALSAGYFAAGTNLVRQVLTTYSLRRALGVRDGLGRKSADEVNAEFLAWVDEGGDGAHPFFAFLNCYDAHGPYLPPPPYDTRFGPLLPGRWPWIQEGVPPDPRALQAEIDAYDGAIAYADAQLEALLGELDRRGLLRDTLVVVTSDHGEEFGEHRVFQHGDSLYGAALHVPLVLSLPGRVPEGRRVDAFVSTRDLAETVRDLAGLSDVPPFPGRSLARFWTDAPAPAPEPVLASVRLSRGHPPWYPVTKGDMTAVVADPLKYIANGDGVEEVYDLRADPDETRDLVGNLPPADLESLRAAAGRR